VYVHRQNKKAGISAQDEYPAIFEKNVKSLLKHTIEKAKTVPRSAIFEEILKISFSQFI
jgi:hypothetical protein